MIIEQEGKKQKQMLREKKCIQSAEENGHSLHSIGTA